MGSITDHAFDIFRGTFIQLSRPPAGSKPELCRTQGALWVSTNDGRIKGWDWEAHDDDSFVDLMARQGWVDSDAVETTGTNCPPKIRVRVVTANEERNEFFFPGFIGKTYVSNFHLDMNTMLKIPQTTLTHNQILISMPLNIQMLVFLAHQLS